MASRRILYAGDDIYLPTRLKDALHGLDCFVVRSPMETARMFIRSEIRYSLLLFDDTAEGAELKAYARTLPHRERTPVIIIKRSEVSGRLLNLIKRQLSLLSDERRKRFVQ